MSIAYWKVTVTAAFLEKPDNWGKAMRLKRAKITWDYILHCLQATLQSTPNTPSHTIHSIRCPTWSLPLPQGRPILSYISTTTLTVTYPTALIHLLASPSPNPNSALACSPPPAVEALPLELQRNFTLMRELDGYAQGTCYYSCGSRNQYSDPVLNSSCSSS